MAKKFNVFNVFDVRKLLKTVQQYLLPLRCFNHISN